MKQSRSMPAFLLILFLPAAGLAHASPRIAPDPFFSEVGAAPEPLSVETLIEASLRASGASENETRVAAAQIHGHILTMKAEVAAQWSDREKAEYVLTFLHRDLFGVYDEFQTRVDRIVTGGGFNCVSSAVLYMIFSRSIGIPVVGIGTADHAFCAAVLDDGRVDVETTSVYGFDPGKKREFHDAFGNVTGYSYVPPSQYSGRVDLSEKQLIALVLQNRISLLESEKRYAEAVELAVDRFALAPGESTRDHLVRGVLNYAALLNEKKQYGEAIDFLGLFVDTYGWSDSLGDIYAILHYNQAVVLIQSGAFSQALRTMDESEAGGSLDPAVLRDLRLQVGERMLAKELPLLTAAEGLSLLASLRDGGLLTEQRYLDFAVMLASKDADRAAAEGDFLAAAGVIDDAIRLLGADGRLKAARAAYRYNYAVEAHNAFAELFNRGDYERALELLTIAIEKVPEINLLRDDLNTLEAVFSTSD
ncbi:MAG: hypothetical protein JW852_11740 [Spirochaetales bacterium]|nr:hypothetical protein [Spirochaetales bacterium]